MVPGWENNNMKIISMHHFVLGGLPLLAVVALSSCGLPSTQISPKATGEQPPAGKCLIIAERSTASLGAWANNDVFDNNHKVGSLGAGGKISWLRGPGTMNLLFCGPGSYERIGTGSLLFGVYEKNGDGGAGRRVACVAGNTYHFKIDCRNVKGLFNPPIFVIEGPGTRIFDE
jgi:hypothetical protein